MADGPGLDLVAAYEVMVRGRRFEERVRELRQEEAVIGSVHLAIGQEATAAGACAALSADDPVFATYRGHAWAIARGVPLEPLFAELLGRSTGVNGGRAGSAYLSAPEWGFYGENSIVGAGAPIAGGAALAFKFDRSGRVALCVFGDGALNQGSVHEAFNFAAAFDLPVVFVCENNRYSELTPIDAMVKNANLFERAAGYGMPGVRIDGNSVADVHAAVAEAAARARAGHGPSLIEAMTERLVGHYIGDAEAYRAPGEVDAARAREPISRLADELAKAGRAADADAARARAEADVAAACAAALDAPLADPATAAEHVYG